jgi:hypothetical protein
LNAFIDEPARVEVEAEADPVFNHMENYDQDWPLAVPIRFWTEFVQEFFHCPAFKFSPSQWAR